MTFPRATPLMQRARSNARIAPPIGGAGGGGGNLHRLAALLSVAALVMLALTTAQLAASTAAEQQAPPPPPPRRVRGPSDSSSTKASTAHSANAAVGPGLGVKLLLAHVAFRHGARTPLVQLRDFAGLKWSCSEQYAGAAVALTAAAAGDAASAAPPPLAPADEAAPELPGGCQMGTLTDRGYEMALQLGRELRARYVDGYTGSNTTSSSSTGGSGGGDGDGGTTYNGSGSTISSGAGLVPREYDPRQVAAHATNYRRTRATLQGVLNGMFPSAKGPFRAAATRERRTFFYPANASCPALMPTIADLGARADTREAAAPRRAADEVRAALKLSDDSGGDSDSGGSETAGGKGKSSKAKGAAAPLKWGALRDVLSCWLAEAPESRPEALTDRLWGVIEAKAAARELAVYAPGPWNCHAATRACNDVLRLSVGPLLWRVLGTMEEAAAAAAAAANSSSSSSGSNDRARLESAGAAAAMEAAAEAAAGGAAGRGGSSTAAAAAVAGAAPPRLYLWSAHDSTVHALLAALGSDAGGAWAPFAADVALELWHDDSGGGVDGGSGGGGGGGGGNSSGSGAFWVRALYLGRPLDLGAGGAAAGGGSGGGSAAASALGRRGGAADGAAAAAQGGWVQLPALRERLRSVVATDDEKERECWGPDA